MSETCGDGKKKDVNFINLESDITCRVYGWPIDEDREYPKVFMSFDYRKNGNAVSGESSFSPEEARKIAALLLSRVDIAEGLQSE